MDKELLKREQVNHLRLKRTFKKSRAVPKGFTLIELLCVVAIILVLERWYVLVSQKSYLRQIDGM